MVKIPWNDAMDALLLDCVIQVGIHVATHGEQGKKWLEVNFAFFNDAKMLSMKPELWKDDPRRLIERYKSIATECKVVLGVGDEHGGVTGNLSKFDGDLLLKYEKMKVILMDIEREEEDKKNRNLKKEKLDQIATQVADPTRPPPSKRHKELPSAGVGTPRVPKARSPDDEIIFRYLNHVTSSETMSESGLSGDDYENILKFLNSNDWTIDQLITAVELDDADLIKNIRKVKLTGIVRLYCNSKGNLENFDKKFREMVNCAYTSLAVFNVIEDWKKNMNRNT